MKDLGRLRHFARQVAREILSDPSFSLMVRETVLLVHAEQEEQRKRSAVRVFLDACRRRGVRLGLDRQGRVTARPREALGELAAVLTVYHEEIAAHLERLRRLEAQRPQPVIPFTRKATS